MLHPSQCYIIEPRFPANVHMGMHAWTRLSNGCLLQRCQDLLDVRRIAQDRPHSPIEKRSSQRHCLSKESQWVYLDESNEEEKQSASRSDSDVSIHRSTRRDNIAQCDRMHYSPYETFHWKRARIEVSRLHRFELTGWEIVSSKDQWIFHERRKKYTSLPASCPSQLFHQMVIYIGHSTDMQMIFTVSTTVSSLVVQRTFHQDTMVREQRSHLMLPVPCTFLSRSTKIWPTPVLPGKCGLIQRVGVGGTFSASARQIHNYL